MTSHSVEIHKLPKTYGKLNLDIPAKSQTWMKILELWMKMWLTVE
jgi:hypothetical protein